MSTLSDLSPTQAPKPFIVDPILLTGIIIPGATGLTTPNLGWLCARAARKTHATAVDLTDGGEPLPGDVMGSTVYPISLPEGPQFLRIVVSYSAFPEGVQAPFLRVRGTTRDLPSTPDGVPVARATDTVVPLYPVTTDRTVWETRTILHRPTATTDAAPVMNSSDRISNGTVDQTYEISDIVVVARGPNDAGARAALGEVVLVTRDAAAYLDTIKAEHRELADELNRTIHVISRTMSGIYGHPPSLAKVLARLLRTAIKEYTDDAPAIEIADLFQYIGQLEGPLSRINDVAADVLTARSLGIVRAPAPAPVTVEPPFPTSTAPGPVVATPDRDPMESPEAEDTWLDGDGDVVWFKDSATYRYATFWGDANPEAEDNGLKSLETDTRVTYLGKMPFEEAMTRSTYGK